MATRSEGARKAWRTRRSKRSFAKARKSENSSKAALRKHCEEHGWKIAFFEGPTGAPRTGIVDAIMSRIATDDADILEVRLVQLKGGAAGLSGPELARLKMAAASARVGWYGAAFDGNVLHIVSDTSE